jgi:hypothetical protein
MGGICGGGGSESEEDKTDSIGSIGGIAGGESGSVLGSVNLTAPDDNKPEDKDDQPFFPSVIGVLDSVLGSLGGTPPEEEKQEGFTISSDAAPLQPAKPMQDLIFGTPVPSTEEPRPAGTGVTIQSGNIYTMKDDEGNVTGTLSALETLKDMKDAQDEYNLNFAGTTGATFGDSMTNMPTILDSLTGEALGQQMPNMPLGTVATQEQFENQEQFIPPDKLFGIFDPVYASPQKSFDAQLQMGQEKDSGSAGTATTATTNEPIFKYFQRAYKGGIPDRFLSGFLTRFGYSPTFIDQQMQVNEDGEIVDASGNLIEGLPNVALIGEQIKQQVA